MEITLSWKNRNNHPSQFRALISATFSALRTHLTPMALSEVRDWLAVNFILAKAYCSSLHDLGLWR